MTEQPAMALGDPDGGFSARAVKWISGIAVCSFLLALLLAAYEDQLGQPISAQPNTFSKSVLGHRALIEFLRDSDLRVLVSRDGSARKSGPQTALLLLEPETTTGENGFQELRTLLGEARSRQAPVVLLLPKWHGKASRDRDARGWIERLELREKQEVHSLLRAIGKFVPEQVELRRRPGRTRAQCQTSWGESLTLEAREMQLISWGSALEPMVWNSHGLLVGQVPGYPLYIISDPDLLNNFGLALADNSVLIVRLLTDVIEVRGVVVDETIHGFYRNEGLMAEIGRFPLVLLPLHGLMLLALVLWAGMGRFGKPRAPASALQAGRQILIDNTARLLDHGGHTAASLRRYYAQTMRIVGQQLAVPADLKLEELTRRLQQLSDARQLRIDLEAIGRGITNLSQRAGDQYSVRLAQSLHQWREEMLHGHRTNR